MSVELNELLALEPIDFIIALRGMNIKIELFQLQVQEIADKETVDLTPADLTNISAYLRKASQFKGLLSIMRDIAALKFKKMTDSDIWKIDQILADMTEEEKKIDDAIPQFLEWKLLWERLLAQNAGR